MHDVNEGIIPFFLTTFFEYCDKQKIDKKSEIIRLVRDYNYGELNKNIKPSKISFTSANLGQNVSQLNCIMIHLPFIFVQFKSKLHHIWISAQSLLKAMQVIFSGKICEDDINTLSLNIELHYICLKEMFGATLIPKHHHVLHYPNAIRKIGPLINYWMMRFESKHQFFCQSSTENQKLCKYCKNTCRKASRRI